VKFNRYFSQYFFWGEEKKEGKIINASDIKVYKAKCKEIDKYNNLNAPEVESYIVDPKK